MKIQAVKTYLTVPHENGEVTFQSPSFRGIYRSIAEQIDKEDLQRPTSSQTASLVYDALQNPKGEYESQIIKILDDRFFWEFTGNLYVPNEGVYLQDNPEIVDGRLSMDKRALIKKLESNNSSVRFVPFGFKTGEQTSIQLMKNSYILGRYGKEGAEKIAEIADKYKKVPYLFSFGSVVNKEKTRMSALGRFWEFGEKLSVDGDGWDGYDDGHSFGVFAPDKSK